MRKQPIEATGIPLAKNLAATHSDAFIAAGIGALRKNMPAFTRAILVSEALGQ